MISKVFRWAVIIAIVIAGIAALFVGGALAHFTSRPRMVSAFRQLVICAAAGGATYAIGSFIGLKTGS